VSSLSWRSPRELLVAGSQLLLWYIPEASPPHVMWQQTIAYPTALAYLSHDGDLIASIGQHDRLVKIWRRLSYEVEVARFDISYLPHPAAVTNLHWRKPWHAEQNLDNLLYTFCADNHVRVWAYSDVRSLSVMHQVAIIDMNASIQPRRLSMSAISQRRYAFIIDSRDFSIATERAVQGSSAKARDYALEHLIEIANRSPEVCVVLDGLGHMSAWGLENAGYKNKNPAVVFHIAHVDGVNITIPQLDEPLEDYAQISVFAGGLTPSSLSLLLHSYAGDIDWYDSQITRLFDTSHRHDRAQLISTLAGPSAPVKRIVRDVQGSLVLSVSEEGNANVWKHTAKQGSAALLRECSLTTGEDVIDLAILSHGRYAAILRLHSLELWDVRNAKAELLGRQSFPDRQRPQRITQVRVAGEKVVTSRVVVVSFDDRTVEAWELLLPSLVDGKRNGHREIIHSLGMVDLHIADRNKSSLYICDNMTLSTLGGRHPPRADASDFALALTDDGMVQMVKSQEEPDTSAPRLFSNARLNTDIRSPAAVSVSGHGKIVAVNTTSTSLVIWDVATSAWEYEHDLDGTDTINTFAWGITPNGEPLLAICFDYHVVVLGQIRYEYPNMEGAWTDLSHIRMRDFTTQSIGDLCWLRSGHIVVGAGNQLFVFEGHADTHRNKDVKALQEAHRRIHNDSTFAVICMLNALVPIFHPTFLSLLILTAKFATTKAILFQLHRSLKFLAEGDALSSFMDVPIEQLIPPPLAPSLPLHLTYSNLASNDHEDTSIDDPQSSIQDIAEGLASNVGTHPLWQLSTEEQSGLVEMVRVSSELEQQERSVDVDALRYLKELYASKDDNISWRAIAFASLSSSQEILIDLVTRLHGGKLTWDAARTSGLFLWLTDHEALRTQMENVARAEYTKHEDRNPIDCSLYYLALGKKSVLLGLWRMALWVREKENTLKLLANNFDEPRWKATALKNAYALLSKRRFQYAAAFFLLGGSLKDAVGVCVHQLKDLQLAIAIARVYSKDDGSVLADLLEHTVLPAAVESDQGRWMASWAYSMLGQQDKAIQVLVRPVHKVVGKSLVEIQGSVASLSYAANDPILTLSYKQLRARLAKQNKWRGIISPKEEWDFVIRSVQLYRRMGCDILALALVRDWEFVPESKAGRPARQHVGAEGAEFEGREREQKKTAAPAVTTKPPPTQFQEPSASSLLDSFGF